MNRPARTADGGAAAPVADGFFPSTMWTVLLAARGDAAERGRALESLCRLYWRPVYVWVRGRGHAPADAEDLTQAFFVKILRQHKFEHADRERGRFRSFLLTMLKRFLADEWDRVRAQRRGGGVKAFSLDVASAETDEALALPLSGAESPERAFDRRWALEVMEHARVRLRGECAAAQKQEIFEALFTVNAAESQAALATRLGLTENAVKMTARRLRRRCEELIREVISETVASSGDLDAEIAHLKEALTP